METAVGSPRRRLTAATKAKMAKAAGKRLKTQMEGKNDEKFLAAVQERAEALATEWTGSLKKLVDLKGQIEAIRKDFQRVRKLGKTIMGCKSFDEFCNKRLNRSRQAVYAVLGDYKKNTAKGKKKGKKGKAGKSVMRIPANLPQMQSMLKQYVARLDDASVDGQIGEMITFLTGLRKRMLEVVSQKQEALAA